MDSPEFEINFDEPFEHLSKAPIVEAVIHWRARAEKVLDPNDLKEEVQKCLNDYASPKALHTVEMEATMGPGATGTTARAQWCGWRFESTNRLYIAQFSRDGLVVSRLQPYEDWNRFTTEAQRLWQIYRDVAEPSEIQRLGVRFINVIEPVQPNRLAEVLVLPPQSPAGLPLEVSEFTHQTTFKVVSSTNQLNLTETIRPPTSGQAGDAGLILDLDVFTTQPLAVDDNETDRRLAELRWLKNKAFFSCVTASAIARFK
jgi:uncharacterized protein (TIGR04255 family)